MPTLRKMMTITFCFSLLMSQVNATCDKCIKIEEERVKKQEANPQPWQYYEDIKSQTKSDLPSKNVSATSNKDFLALNGDDNPNEPPMNEEFFEEENPSNNKTSGKTKEQQPSNLEKKEVVPPKSDSSKTYSSIYTALRTKHFLETLDHSFTLLIPTNEALQKLPEGTLTDLIRPENSEKLAALISNHVIARKILYRDFKENDNLEVKAISGKNLTLSSKDGQLFIENAQILNGEAEGYDGVIYLIDKVLAN